MRLFDTHGEWDSSDGQTFAVAIRVGARLPPSALAADRPSPTHFGEAMRRRTTSRTFATFASLAGLSFVLSACSDTTAPRSLTPAGRLSTVVPTLPGQPAGTTAIPLVS